MPKINIRNHKTGQVIYQGIFNTARKCVEQAVREKACLDYADLHRTNLCNASLDDAIMRHALLDGANLTGANLSESTLDGTTFRNATLHGTCLCFSSLNNCNFEEARFGATDIAGTRINRYPRLKPGFFSGTTLRAVRPLLTAFLTSVVTGVLIQPRLKPWCSVFDRIKAFSRPCQHLRSISLILKR